MKSISLGGRVLWRGFRGSVSQEESQSKSLTDNQLLALFHEDPQEAWRMFTQKFSDLIFSTLQKMGFDYDESMDRFVYIFEQLCEHDFRRLKSVRYAGSYGDLTPWLKAVVQNLTVNWLRSSEGRKRLLKPIAKLRQRDQRIFQLYFWKGYSPSAISEQLRLEQFDVDLPEVLDCLEHIFSVLTEKKRWRLMSNILKISRNVRIDEIDEETGVSWEPPDTRLNPEEAVIEKEADQRMRHALEKLTPEDQLLLRLRYVDGATLKQLCAIFHASEKGIQQKLRIALQGLRRNVGG